RVRLIDGLCHGVGLRALSFMTSVHRDTINRLGMAVGEGCARVHDRIFRAIPAGYLQLDELWGWVHTKQGHIAVGVDDSEIGDQWTFTALDVTSRAYLSWHTGKRTGDNTDRFLADLASRIEGIPTMASDGFKPYVGAVEKAFG